MTRRSIRRLVLAAMKERGPDLAMLVLGLVILAAVRGQSFAALLGALAVAFVVVNAVRLVGVEERAPALPRSAWAIAILLVLAVPVRELLGRANAFAENEGLSGLIEHVSDRARLEDDPSIAPPLVPVDRPLTYFVHASGERVRVRLGPSLDWIPADALGHGVFRIDYDPVRDGAPAGSAHETTVSVDVDGVVRTRTLLLVTPSPHPRWLRLSPDRARACVPSEETDEVITFAGDEEPVRTPALDGPTDCAIGDDGSLLVSHRYADDLLAIEGGERRSIAIGAPGAVAISVVDDAIYVAMDGEEGALLRLARSGPPHVERVAIGGHPVFLAPGGAGLIVSTTGPATLARVSSQGPFRLVTSRTLVSPAVHMTPTPDGEHLVVALTDFVEDGAPHLGNHFIEDRLATFDARTLALVSEQRTARRTPRQDHAGDVDRGASPMGLCFTATGALLTAFAGTNEVWEQNGLAPPRVLDTAAHGLSAPFSAGELANGSLVVTSPSSGRIVVFAADRTPVRTLELASADRALLRSDPGALELRYGERAFYEATRAGVACQSCHLHGGSDGAFHNIGGRLAAPTLDVRGVQGTSPYLRDGSYPLLRDLHEVSLAEFRGYREPGGDRARTLEAWMRTLPPVATHVARDLARERAGVDVFFRAGCPDCHAPPAFTALTLHPIEAVFPDARVRAEGRVLDVPSLRSLAASAPYLYDGRARTIEAVFREHNESDRHGHTGALSDEDLAALFSFLRSL